MGHHLTGATKTAGTRCSSEGGSQHVMDQVNRLKGVTTPVAQLDRAPPRRSPVKGRGAGKEVVHVPIKPESWNTPGGLTVLNRWDFVLYVTI